MWQISLFLFLLQKSACLVFCILLLYISLFLDGHYVDSSVATMNNASLNTLVQYVVRMYIFYSFRYIPSSELAGSHNNFIFLYLITSSLFPSNLHYFTMPWTIIIVTIPSHCCSYLFSLIFWIQSLWRI